MNIVQFRYKGEFVYQNSIDWAFHVGDKFEFWGGLNEVVSVRVILQAESGLHVTQVVEVESIGYNLADFLRAKDKEMEEEREFVRGFSLGA